MTERLIQNTDETIQATINLPDDTKQGLSEAQEIIFRLTTHAELNTGDVVLSESDVEVIGPEQIQIELNEEQTAELPKVKLYGEVRVVFDKSSVVSLNPAFQVV